MRDFTLSIYRKLIEQINDSGYAFQTVENFIENPEDRVAILRHDVDRIPKNALKMALIEKKFGISSSYYFRIIGKVWNKKIIKKIADLGHEVGYHYEDLSLKKGDTEKAIEHFEKNLKKIRKIYPSKTICMHGSPLSCLDNRDLWKIYNYRDYGIIAEPYYDIDYSDVFYITDTGRSWNNENVSVRDQVDSGFNILINSTFDIINLVKSDQLPDKIMINTHPHRWFEYGLGWYKELMGQSLKNSIKTILIKGKK